MDLKQLEYIIAIAEEQSIAKAAQKLFMTQSGLNQQLLKLERELGLWRKNPVNMEFPLPRTREICYDYM